MNDSPSNLSRRDVLSAGIGVALTAAAASAGAQPMDMPTSSRELWQWVRTQPVLDLQQPYLDVASGGPTLRSSMAAEYRAREAQSLSIASLSNDFWTAETTRLATRVATFLGADADEIAFTRGTGEALAMVAAGLNLAEGDEILTTTREHPAALSPWLVLARRRGVVVKQIELPAPMSAPEQALGLFAGAVTDRTRVIAFSHVQYSDGAVLPAKELCQFARQRNILSVVDGAQALGMLDFQVRDLGCDFYAAASHKWLGGGHGVGFLVVRRDALDRLWPIEPRGLDASTAIAAPTQSFGNDGVPATLHKLGNIVPLAWPALRGVEAALEFQQTVLRNRIEARVRELAIYQRMRLQQLPGIELLTPGRPGLWAGILTFRVPGRSARDLATFLSRGYRVVVRDLQWQGAAEGALRASAHIYNSHDDIEKLLSGLQQALKN
jgi:selenocysteine lyase/cysteine desulfurase